MMSRTVATGAAVLFLVAQAARADSFKEQRCSDLGSNCVCSDTLDVNDGSVSAPHNWSNSPSASDCDIFDWAGGNIFADSAASVGMPAGSSVKYVQNLKDTDFQSFSGDTTPNGPARECLRWYVKYSNTIDRACSSTNSKLITVHGTDPGGSHNAFDMEEQDGSCGSGPPYNNFIAFSATGEHDISSDCGPYQSKCNDSPIVGNHQYGPGDCINNWCRIEVCLTTRGEGGNLGSAGAGPYWAESYVQPIDGKSPESFVRNYMGDSSWDACAGGGRCSPDDFAVNMNIDTGSDDYWISYLMQARWSTDSGQRIGGATEFEGGGGGGGGSSPVCGNGAVETGEDCDDGNTISGDGCSSTCMTEVPSSPICGNGTVETGEQCDDGNTISGDGCSSTCVTEVPSSPVCGDGNLDSGEQCDDGNTTSGDGCSSTCTIEASPAGGVVFSDDFEGSLSSIRANWGNGSSGNITLVSDVPAGSPGSQAIRLDAGAGGTGYLFHQLPQNYDELYFRYYVKYEAGTYHHSGGMIGGYDPPTSYPQGDAGLKGIRPNGDRLLNFAFEALTGLPTDHMDTYASWVDMQGSDDGNGNYYGRLFLEDLNIPQYQQWTCVEMRLKMNTPVNQKTGEWQLWVNGTQVANMVPGSPNGYWDTSGNWHFDAGSPGFEGFRWRDRSSLGLNWVKVQNYDATPRVWVDDVVVSTARVGCNGQSGGGGGGGGGGGSALALSTTASVMNTDATISATVANGTGPYHFLFDCTDDGNWDSPILAATSQTSVQHTCAYGAAGTFDVRTQVWDEGTNTVLQDLRSVTISPTSVQIGTPGKPYLVQ